MQHLSTLIKAKSLMSSGIPSFQHHFIAPIVNIYYQGTLPFLSLEKLWNCVVIHNCIIVGFAYLLRSSKSVSVQHGQLRSISKKGRGVPIFKKNSARYTILELTTTSLCWEIVTARYCLLLPIKVPQVGHSYFRAEERWSFSIGRPILSLALHCWRTRQKLRVFSQVNDSLSLQWDTRSVFI